MAGPAAKKMTGAVTGAEEEPPIEVSSLMGALEDMLEVPVGKRTVQVRSLEVQHAAALIEMLHFQTSRRRWEVEDFRTLKVFASADCILVIIRDALLPILANDPTSLHALDLLERYGNRLHTLSIKVGGTFEEEIDFVYQDLIRHVNEGRAKPLAVSVSELIIRSNSIRARISTLRDQVVGISDNTLSEHDSDGDISDDGGD